MESVEEFTIEQLITQGDYNDLPRTRSGSDTRIGISAGGCGRPDYHLKTGPTRGGWSDAYENLRVIAERRQRTPEQVASQVFK